MSSEATTNRDTTATKEVRLQLELTTTPDNLRVLLSCGPETAKATELLSEIQARLAAMGIKGEVDKEAVAVALRDVAANGGGIEDLAILHGRPPTSPVDERIEWSQDDFFAQGWFVDPETRRIDFRQCRAAASVDKDQLLGTLLPAQPGADGIDVFGNPIPALAPCQASLRCGDNVVWDGAAKGWRAQSAGRVALTGNLLQVVSDLKVSGDVGAASGNVEHKGHVAISGSVESQYKVVATGNIDIAGNIGSSTVVCGGMLTVKGGLCGNGVNRIFAMGDVYCKYIDNTELTSEGSVYADLELVQAKLRCRGELSCGGRVVGGELMAGKNITVNEVGSRVSTETTLIAGVDYKLKDTLKANVTRIESEQQKIDKLNVELKRLDAQKDLLDHQQREAMTEFSFLLEELTESTQALRSENERIVRAIKAGDDACIVIKERAYPGTKLQIQNAHYEVEEILTGPIVARYDSARNQIRLTGH